MSLLVHLITIMRVTFIGDVHGCYNTLLLLLERIPRENNRIIFLGDLINKGKRSFEVFNYVKTEGYECILGNHEYYCIHRHRSDTRYKWQRQGGKETEASVSRILGLKSDKEVQVILAEMSYYFERLPSYLIIPTAYNHQLVVTHGGISRGLFRQKKYDLNQSLQTSKESSSHYLFNKESLASIPNTIQIIGHKPTSFAPLQIEGNFLVDSGCVYLERRGMGYLSALTLDLEKDEPPVFLRQPNID